MLKTSLSTFDATMVVAGSMIGSGIFIVSSEIARTVQSPALLLGVWIVTGLFTLCAALSYGELAGMMPSAGGQYVYLREAFGPLAGFLYGWTLYTVIQTGTIAAVAMAFAKYSGVLLPAVSESSVLISFAGIDVSPAHLLAMGTIVFLTYINSRGLRFGRLIQNVFTVTKVGALLFLIVVGIAVGVGSNVWQGNVGGFWTAMPASSVDLFDIATYGVVAAISVAMVGSIFSSDAWNNITFVASEVTNARSSIPKALFWGVSIVSGLYLLANLAYMAVLSFPDIQTAPLDRVGSAAAKASLGTVGEVFMAALIMISTFGCNNGIILSGARAYYAMAVDKMFFRSAAELNSNHVPGRSLWMQAAWACALCLSGKYSELLQYVVIAVLLFYILTVLGIFRLRRTKPNVPRPVKAFGYPIIPALYIAIALLICYYLVLHTPMHTVSGIIIIVIGIPVYYLRRVRIGR